MAKIHDITSVIVRAMDPDSAALGAFSAEEKAGLLRFASSPSEFELIEALSVALNSVTADGYLLSSEESSLLTTRYPQLVPALFKKLKENSERDYAGFHLFENTSVSQKFKATCTRLREVGIVISETELKKRLEKDAYHPAKDLDELHQLLSDSEAMDEAQVLAQKLKSPLTLERLLKWASFKSKDPQKLIKDKDFMSFVGQMAAYDINSMESFEVLIQIYSYPNEKDFYLNSQNQEKFHSLMARFEVINPTLLYEMEMRSLLALDDTKKTKEEVTLFRDIPIQDSQQLLFALRQARHLPAGIDKSRALALREAVLKNWGVRLSIKSQLDEKPGPGRRDLFDFLQFVAHYPGDAESLEKLFTLNEGLPIPHTDRFPNWYESYDLGAAISKMSSPIFIKNYWAFRERIANGNGLDLWGEHGNASIDTLADKNFNLELFIKRATRFISKEKGTIMEFGLPPEADGVFALLEKYHPHFLLKKEDSLTAFYNATETARGLQSKAVRDYLEFTQKIQPQNPFELGSYTVFGNEMLAQAAERFMKSGSAQKNARALMKSGQFNPPPEELVKIEGKSLNAETLANPKYAKSLHWLQSLNFTFEEILECAKPQDLALMEIWITHPGLAWIRETSFQFSDLVFLFSKLHETKTDIQSFANYLINYSKVYEKTFDPKRDLPVLVNLFNLPEGSQRLELLGKVDKLKKYTNPQTQLELWEQEPTLLSHLREDDFQHLLLNFSEELEGELPQLILFYDFIQKDPKLGAVLDDPQFLITYQELKNSELMRSVVFNARTKMELMLSIAQTLKQTGFINLKAELENLIPKAGRTVYPNDMITLLTLVGNERLQNLYENPQKLNELLAAQSLQHPDIVQLQIEQGHMSQVNGRYTERPHPVSLDPLNKIKLFLAFESLQKPEVQKQIAELIEADIANKNTELGGVVVMREGGLFIQSLPAWGSFDGAYSKMEDVMKNYLQPQSESAPDLANASSDFDGGVLNLHLHSLTEDCHIYAGPSGMVSQPSRNQKGDGDFGAMELFGQAGLVITSLKRDLDGRVIWNADFFCVREGNESERERKYPFVYDLGSY